LKGWLLHVAADSTNMGISGPINPDNGYFDYIPLGPEDNDSSEKLTYSALGLSHVIPAEYDGLKPHYDPNPHHFVYGEPLESDRGKQLVKLRPGDYFFPVASLAPVRKETYVIRTKEAIADDQKGRMAKYVIGWYEIAAILQVRKTQNMHRIIAIRGSVYVPQTMEAQVRECAHFKRPSDVFVCAVGVKDGRKTCLLKSAKQLTEPGAPFKPNKFGLMVYGNKTFPRGWKWILDEAQLASLLSEIKNL
jgi:hypothetical protein